MTDLVLILGDQLSDSLSCLRRRDPSQTVVLMAEVMGEATYVRHHRKKIVLVLAAMRHFAARLRAAGWRVDYVALDDEGNTGTLGGELERAVRRHGASAVFLTAPGEWRLKLEADGWAAALGVPVTVIEDDRFVASHADFETWAEGRKALRMEFFYREMRRRTGLLMDGEAPAGGRWNFDVENRAPPAGGLFLPEPLRHDPDAGTQAVLEMVARRFPDGFGSLDDFRFAVTREQAQASLAYFLEVALPRFGDDQDGMLQASPYLHHAVLSPYLNIGLLEPLEVCKAVETAWRGGGVPLNAAEGFIRQVIGWREYVRGVYWREGPAYVFRNALEARRPLPDFYWTGQTGMACLQAAISQTLDLAYAHHIQRLMVTGNFALLAGVDPHVLHEWYLGAYADAFEWVEAPNTIGMSQYADGGLLGSKPYAASGSYIHRMSDYCGGCAYDVKARSGTGACPFNRLYWDFIDRHAARFASNPRMAQSVRTLERMGEDRRREIRADATACLAELGL
ncbi:cryptochrome/photolyase family protein [Phenylobacterium sp.]|uniref:cryptochrome/photolyase family protein n=1 Tax=Phenylobacterium sp. TaxID=1871053 RepID=UPI0025CB9471|nr:cryptochrome/photolyase family protein [Phenylobacterium sp.]MCA3741428.1 cryptochrome/photolyase family protein [Phenylobacterium sp.]